MIKIVSSHVSRKNWGLVFAALMISIVVTSCSSENNDVPNPALVPEADQESILINEPLVNGMFTYDTLGFLIYERSDFDSDAKNGAQRLLSIYDEQRNVACEAIAFLYANDPEEGMSLASSIYDVEQTPSSYIISMNDIEAPIGVGVEFLYAASNRGVVVDDPNNLIIKQHTFAFYSFETSYQRRTILEIACYLRSAIYSNHVDRVDRFMNSIEFGLD